MLCINASSWYNKKAFAEDVVFIIPGSSDPRVIPSFDPAIQIISKGQSIAFVNPDGIDHQLQIKSADGALEFDTGLLKPNEFVSHTFSNNGEFTIQDSQYDHMKGEIKVTDDTVVQSKVIESQNLEVQLMRSPANLHPNDEIYYKITFVDLKTHRNHPHIDFVLNFADSSGNHVDGAGGHSVDGQEFAKFKFDKEETLTPTVTISGISFVPIQPEDATFETVVTPEFPALGVVVAVTSGMLIVAFLARKYSFSGFGKL